jgi:mannitol operon repressor
MDKLRTESDRGKVLISTGLLEEQLKQLLLEYFVDDASLSSLVEGGSAPLASFSARITTCYALGIIRKIEHDDLHQVRRIRNDFAHNIHTSFETQSVVDRCKALRTKSHDYKYDALARVVVPASGQFNTATTFLILNLVDRPHYVRKERRESKEWPYLGEVTSDYKETYGRFVFCKPLF